MISNTESYINKAYQQKYSSVATCLVYCAALSYGGIAHDNGHSFSFEKTDKQYGYNQEIFYNTQSPSWIPFDNISNAELNPDADVFFDASVCLDIVKKFSFMVVDEEADKRIEEYFASIPVRTKVIFKNHRINKG